MNGTNLTAGKRPQPVRIWVPVSLLIWLVVMPLALIASPILLVACPFCRLNPLVALPAMFGLLAAVASTRVDIDTPDASVHLF